MAVGKSSRKGGAKKPPSPVKRRAANDCTQCWTGRSVGMRKCDCKKRGPHKKWIQSCQRCLDRAASYMRENARD